MSYSCRGCGGLVIEGEERHQNWGYGGKWCDCNVPHPPVLTESDIRRIVREELHNHPAVTVSGEQR